MSRALFALALAALLPRADSYGAGVDSCR